MNPLQTWKSSWGDLAAQSEHWVCGANRGMCYRLCDTALNPPTVLDLSEAEIFHQCLNLDI